MKRNSYMAVVVAMVGFLGAALSRAEVLVYELSFQNTGPGVNYSFVRDGFMVVDTTELTFSTIVVLTDPTTFQLYYTSSLINGSYMSLLSETDNSLSAVAYSLSGSGSENVAFQVIGNMDSSVNFSHGDPVPVARHLSGIMIASAPQTGNLTTSGNFTYGFAGANKVSASFMSSYTKVVNQHQLSINATISDLGQNLQNHGIVPDATPAPSPSPGSSPSPAPSPSPTPAFSPSPTPTSSPSPTP